MLRRCHRRQSTATSANHSTTTPKGCMSSHMITALRYTSLLPAGALWRGLAVNQSCAREFEHRRAGRGERTGQSRRQVIDLDLCPG